MILRGAKSPRWPSSKLRQGFRQHRERGAPQCPARARKHLGGEADHAAAPGLASGYCGTAAPLALAPRRQSEPTAFDRKDAKAVRRRRATANRVLTYLKAALNHAWRAGLVPSDDAWRRVKPFKSVDAPLVRYLSRDEITRFLNSCQGAFRDLLHTA